MLLDAPLQLRWLFLDLNSYFASVEQQLNPALRGQPVAVVPLETDSTCAIAASYEAKAYGIKTGTRIFEARRMCPHLICVQADHQRYVTFHHRIIEAIERHIPITHVASIDEFACELDASERNTSAATALAQRIKAEIATQVGEMIRCSIGIAPNRFLAKVATDMRKPDGLVVIEPYEIPQRLYPLALSDIPGLGRGMQQRLYRAGVGSMEQLYALAPKQMRALWHSVEGERMYYRLRGVELPEARGERRSVSHSHVLPPDQRPQAQASQHSQRMLAKAVSRMRRLGYAAQFLGISMRLESGGRVEAQRRCAPLDDHISLQRLWQEAWEQAMHGQPSTVRIKKVSVVLSSLIAREAIQPGLLEWQSPPPSLQAERADPVIPPASDGSARQRLSAAMDALNQRFGRGTVSFAATLGQASDATGTKIAFSRIPQREEFQE